MFHERFFKRKRPGWVPRYLGALGHPQRPRQAQPWSAASTNIHKKNLHGACLYTIFQRQIDLKQSQHDQEALRHPR